MKMFSEKSSPSIPKDYPIKKPRGILLSLVTIKTWHALVIKRKNVR